MSGKKLVALLGVGVLLVIVAWVALTRSRGRSFPDWLETGPVATSPVAPPADPLETLQAAGRVELNAARLRQLLMGELSASQDGRVLLQATRSFQVRIADGRVEAGGLLDLSRVDVDQLSPRVRAAVAGLRRWAGFLGPGERYVGLSASPVAQDGGIGLGQGATLTIGELPLPLSTLVSLAGATAVDEPVLHLEGLRVTRVAVIADRLVVEAQRSP